MAQPPSAGAVGRPLPLGVSPLLAKPAMLAYKRNLPHFQPVGKPVYITTCTFNRWVLPEPVRDLVLRHCVHDHGLRYELHAAVIMPDHMHLILTPMQDRHGAAFGLAEIMNGMKGASAHTLNKALGRRGHVWQAENMDHVIRSQQEFFDKLDYLCKNPVRKGLVRDEDDYPWLWREWVEGKRAGARGAR